MAGETSREKNKAAKIGAIGVIVAAVVGALVTGIFAFLKPDKAPAQNVNNSPCGILTGNQINCNNPQGEPFPVTSQTPVGSGPWPFKTINTWGDDGVDHGAVVRPCNQQDCGCKPKVLCRYGVAKGNTTVYARCQTHSNFGGPGVTKDSVWFKIAWPNKEITATTVYVSKPDDLYSGWILGTSLSPEGHNGNIPACG